MIHLNQLQTSLINSLKNKVKSSNERLFICNNALKNLNPKSVLGRGYLIAFNSSGNILKSVKDVPNEKFRLTFHDGDTNVKKPISYSFLLSLFVGCGSVGIKKNYQTNYKISPGQLVKIEIPSKINRVECGEKSHEISIKENQKFFIYAESYFSKNKNIKCSGLVNGKKSFEVDVQVVQKDYPFETLRVNPKRVKLSKKDLNRVIKERKLLKRVYGNGDKSLLIDKSFVHPLQSKVTSSYGTRRLFNNVKKSQHLGIDYRAAVGVPIPSSNKGKVVSARNLLYG